ncbi:CueP family metal-binding protein [Kocuria flava]|uniref:Uncharacterized protein n=1 Tax=Kocuria flava TaxID=446860 RepID=A0ABQ0X0J6_9MICC|nr:CueP family metal-binding protein [Kocuria flava]GEO90953.1 hypothetical protein KFL01_02590 [Kocuria flava]
MRTQAHWHAARVPSAASVSSRTARSLITGSAAATPVGAASLSFCSRGQSRCAAIAPYREQTHDCHFHSLTTCLGELPNTEVQLTLTGEDGKVLLDETRQTYDNGFVGIWVPRGIEATLTIEHEGQSGTATVSTTDEDDPSCITTLQLT